MGIPIARNLAFKARSAMYLQLHSRDPRKLRMVSDAISTDGATCAMRLHHRYSTMTKWCDVLLLTLSNRQAAARVLLEDEEALIPCARPGQIIVDHTTVDVELSRRCGIEAEKRGAFFLDAPMSGSPRAVFNNQLVLMVGGAAEHYQRLLPIFRLYADNIHHMGHHGSGTATKLVAQALVASHNAAAAEAMIMANRLGIEDHRRLVQVLDASWGSSTMLRRNAGAMQDAIRSPDAVPPTSHASIDHLLEDLSLLDESLPEPDAHSLSHSSHQHASSAVDNDGKERFPVLDASLRMLGAAQETGMGSRDLSAVVHFIQAAAAMERECSTPVSSPLWSRNTSPNGVPSADAPSSSVRNNERKETYSEDSKWINEHSVSNDELYSPDRSSSNERQYRDTPNAGHSSLHRAEEWKSEEKVEEMGMRNQEELLKWSPMPSQHGRLSDEPQNPTPPHDLRRSPFSSTSKDEKRSKEEEEEFY